MKAQKVVTTNQMTRLNNLLRQRFITKFKHREQLREILTCHSASWSTSVRNRLWKLIQVIKLPYRISKRQRVHLTS